MANTIKIKNSGTASAAPSSLEFGELGLNYADGKIYYKNSSNAIVQFSSASAAANANTLTGTTLASGVTISSLTSVGIISTGTWSASFGAVSGANLTNLTAGNLSGTIPSGVLGNSSHFIGTTSIALNRSSATQTLTGTSISGSARDSEIRFYMEVI